MCALHGSDLGRAPTPLIVPTPRKIGVDVREKTREGETSEVSEEKELVRACHCVHPERHNRHSGFLRVSTWKWENNSCGRGTKLVNV